MSNVIRMQLPMRELTTQEIYDELTDAGRYRTMRSHFIADQLEEGRVITEAEFNAEIDALTP